MRKVNWKKDIWFNNNKVALVNNMTGPGTIGHIRRGCIGYRQEGELNYEIPWAFVNMSGRGCGILNEQLWKNFQVMPKRCRESCYKVIIKPQSVYELYMFFKDFQQMSDLFGWGGKAGIDLRWYTFGHYLGVIYHSDLDEAQACYEHIRKHIFENENYTVLNITEQEYEVELVEIKKGCTEMNHPGFGGFLSNQWEDSDLVPYWDQEEAYLDDIFDLNDASDSQPEWLHNKIIYTWCELAHLTGDPTYRKVLGEDPFAYEDITYHKPWKGGEPSEQPTGEENRLGKGITIYNLT